MALPETTSISNSIQILEWFVNDFSKSYESNRVSINGLKRDQLKQVFGPHTTCKNYTNRNWIWRVGHEGYTFQILNSRGGTSVEIEVDYDYWMENRDHLIPVSLRFLESVRKQVDEKL